MSKQDLLLQTAEGWYRGLAVKDFLGRPVSAKGDRPGRKFAERRELERQDRA